MNSISFFPDSSKKEPLYEQLYSSVVNEIHSGRLAPGSRLPSKRSLSEQLRISIGTIETAYSMLIAEGYIVSKPRSGYFTCEIETPIFVSKDAFSPNPSAGRKTEREPLRHIVKTDTETKCGIIDFSIGAVDTSAFPYDIWSRITRSVICEESKLLMRGNAQGDEALRNALSAFLYETRGVCCTPEQIIIGAGIEYLLNVIAQLLDRKTVYAFENPGYRKALEIMKNLQLNMRMIDIDNQGMCVDKLEESNANIAYITPSHQFPAGITMPIGRRMKLLNWAIQHDAYIIEDDYDSEFRYDMRPLPALQGIDRFGRVLYMGTFSRSIAPSIRAAYLVLPESLLNIYRDKFRLYSSTVSRIEQHTLARFIDGGYFARHLRRMTLKYKRKRDALIDALSQETFASGMNIKGEHAGLHFAVCINAGFTEDELIRRALNCGVRLNGLSSFNASAASGAKPTLIFGYAGLSEPEIQKGVELLGKAWK